MRSSYFITRCVLQVCTGLEYAQWDPASFHVMPLCHYYVACDTAHVMPLCHYYVACDTAHVMPLCHYYVACDTAHVMLT